jgi:hypothetical protein
MMLHFRNSIFIVNQNNHWIQILYLRRLEPRLGKDYDFVSGLEVPRRRTIQADVTLVAFAWHHVGLPKGAIREVRDVHILEGRDAAGFEEGFVNGDRAFIMQIGLSDRRPMNFRHARANQHISIVTERTAKASGPLSTVRVEKCWASPVNSSVRLIGKAIGQLRQADRSPMPVIPAKAGIQPLLD